MPVAHIFVCHDINEQNRQYLSLFDIFCNDLRNRNIQVITYPGRASDDGFLPFFFREVLTCQWFIIFQTAGIAEIAQVQVAVATTQKLVEQQQMQGIYRFVVNSHEAEQGSLEWSVIPDFDATYDYLSAFETFLSTLLPDKSVLDTNVVVLPSPLPPPPPPSQVDQVSIASDSDDNRPVTTLNLSKPNMNLVHFYQRNRQKHGRLIGIGLGVCIIIVLLGLGLNFLPIHNQLAAAPKGALGMQNMTSGAYPDATPTSRGTKSVPAVKTVVPTVHTVSTPIVTPTSSSSSQVQVTPTPSRVTTPDPTKSVTITNSYDGKDPYQTGCATHSDIPSTTPAVSFDNGYGTITLYFSYTCHTAWAYVKLKSAVPANASGNADISVSTGGSNAKTYSCNTSGGDGNIEPGQTACYTPMAYDGPDQSASAKGQYTSASGSVYTGTTKSY
ncbi:MAG TPA: DUF2690 domain-containing protein [Dictyobacter sp.]|jgi:hypothetical protein|nr:DUF2690 domain-containing protein [Dictyobacter sp.]